MIASNGEWNDALQRVRAYSSSRLTGAKNVLQLDQVNVDATSPTVGPCASCDLPHLLSSTNRRLTRAPERMTHYARTVQKHGSVVDVPQLLTHESGQSLINPAPDRPPCCRLRQTCSAFITGKGKVCRADLDQEDFVSNDLWTAPEFVS